MAKSINGLGGGGLIPQSSVTKRLSANRRIKEAAEDSQVELFKAQEKARLEEQRLYAQAQRVVQQERLLRGLSEVTIGGIAYLDGLRQAYSAGDHSPRYMDVATGQVVPTLREELSAQAVVRYSLGCGELQRHITEGGL